MLKHKTRTNQSTKSLSIEGILEMHHKGYGFLRNEKTLARRADDAFVSASMIKRHSMRSGSHIAGVCENSGPKRSPKLVRVQSVDGRNPNASASRFEELTPTNPRKWLRLEGDDHPISMRVLDLLCPLGLGQRALIASPPRAGKTTLLKQIARSVANNLSLIHI